MTDLPAAAITAAARQLAHCISGTEREPWPEPDEEDILWATRALEAAAPHLTPADPTTETEGFRAYQAGLAAGRAEGAVAERERIRRFSATLGTDSSSDDEVMALIQQLLNEGAAAEREKIRAAIADEYGPSAARKMRRVLLGDAP